MTGAGVSRISRRSLLAWAASASCIEQGVEEVRIRSTIDGEMQPAWLLPPQSTKPAPLVVHLHTWSARYNDSSDLATLLAGCRTRGWAMISPDFRGQNDHPQACASRFAVQDVLDAVEFARKRAHLDERRLYVAGGSGGGHMALAMAHSAPRLWAAVSAWVPISDLAAWHRFSKQKGDRYWETIERCCGGPPGSPQTDPEYRARSPLFHLARAAGLPVDIETGIHDGHHGSVPVSQSLRAFNALAEANGLAERKIAEEAIEATTRDAAIPPGLKSEDVGKGPRRSRALFRRSAGPARLTIFDGGHEIDFPEALRWLETQRRNA